MQVKETMESLSHKKSCLASEVTGDESVSRSIPNRRKAAWLQKSQVMRASAEASRTGAHLVSQGSSQSKKREQ